MGLHEKKANSSVALGVKNVIYMNKTCQTLCVCVCVCMCVWVVCGYVCKMVEISQVVSFIMVTILKVWGKGSGGD